MKISTFVFVITSLALTGCATSETLDSTPAGKPVALTQAEVESLLVGSTFPLSQGGMYFESETAVTILWDGATEETSWFSTDEGAFCYTAELFGGQEECLVLQRLPGGDYVRIYDGQPTTVKASSIVAGKAF
jgi:hypothetical protein